MLKRKNTVASLAAMSLITGLVNNSLVTYASDVDVAVKGKTKQIDILSFNDFHGNVLANGKNVGAATLAGVINEYQAKDEASDTYGAVTVSGGDLYQGTAISNVTVGEPVTAMLQEINIVASAIGNHEYDWGADKIQNWANEGNFKFVAANVVYEETGQMVEYAKPYVMTESDGVQIAFIGIATPETLSSTKKENVEGLDFLDVVETLNTWSPVVRAEGADIVVALTHSGATENADGTITGEAADIAEQADDVDAVIAAHNHKFVDGKVNGRPVVQAGYNGRGLSVISFTVDENNKIISSEANTRKLYEETNLPVNTTVESKVNAINDGLKDLLSEKVTDLEFDLDHHRDAGVTPLGVTVAHAMKEIGQTDVAIVNGGGIRAPLTAGEITVGDMYTILPFDNQLVTLKVKGSELKKLIEHGINPKDFGWGQFAGLKVWYDNTTNTITSMRLEDGTLVEDDQEYTVTTLDFLITGGDSYDFSNADDVVDTCEVMREGIQKYWKANGIEALEYDLLIAGEDTTEDKPEVDVPVEDEENNTEVKPEVKPEDNETSKGEEGNSNIIAGGSNNTNNNETNKGDKLPNTGAPVSSVQIFAVALLLVVAGTVLTKKNKEIV